MSVKTEGGPVGNIKAVKHQGETAVKALQKGEPMKGLAVEACSELEARVSMTGWASLLHENAIRANACAQLYWNALQKALEVGDMNVIDRYSARFGWLVGVSNRSILEAMKAERLQAGDMAGAEAIIAEFRGENDTQNS